MLHKANKATLSYFFKNNKLNSQGINNQPQIVGKPVRDRYHRVMAGEQKRNSYCAFVRLKHVLGGFNKKASGFQALILINYIALSSDAVAYSPFPAIYDKGKKKEITTAGKELDAVIECYEKWFNEIRKNGMGQFYLPMISKQYEWYGSLFNEQRLYKKHQGGKSFIAVRY